MVLRLHGGGLQIGGAHDQGGKTARGTIDGEGKSLWRWWILWSSTKGRVCAGLVAGAGGEYMAWREAGDAAGVRPWACSRLWLEGLRPCCRGEGEGVAMCVVLDLLRR